jgi:acetyltransferase-like isoleucine patch superfamily enzyme
MIRSAPAKIWRDFRLYLATLIGWVPSHTVRLLFYTTVLHIKIGRHSSIHWRARFFHPEGIRIGHNTIIGNDAFLDGRAGLDIGNNVNLAGEVNIFTMEHDVQSPTFAVAGGPVIIEDYVYLATRSMILPGVRVGRGAVVAAGAVVTKDVSPYSIVGGVPARVIGERTKDLRYTLKHARLFQ